MTTDGRLASPSLPPAPSPPPTSPLNMASTDPAQDNALSDDDASSGIDTPDESNVDSGRDYRQEQWFSLDTTEDVALDMDLTEDDDGERDGPDSE